MAAPVRRRGEGVTAAVVVAGPTIRFTEERMLACGADLLAASGELALLGHASPLLDSREGGTWGNSGR